jgi:NADH-quinone oxidoreductase subunit M
MGFVTFGLFAMNRQGIDGAMMVMLGHGLVSGALFLCVGVVYDRLHTREIAATAAFRTTCRLRLAVHDLHMASVGLPAPAISSASFLSHVGTYRASSWARSWDRPGSSSALPTCLAATWRIMLRNAAERRCGKRCRTSACANGVAVGPIALAVFWKLPNTLNLPYPISTY